MEELLSVANEATRKWLIGAIVGAIVADKALSPTEEEALQRVLAEATGKEYFGEVYAHVSGLTEPPWIDEPPALERSESLRIINGLIRLCVLDGGYSAEERDFVGRLCALLELDDVTEKLQAWADALACVNRIDAELFAPSRG